MTQICFTHPSGKEPIHRLWKEKIHFENKIIAMQSVVCLLLFLQVIHPVQDSLLVTGRVLWPLYKASHGEGNISSAQLSPRCCSSFGFYCSKVSRGTWSTANLHPRHGIMSKNTSSLCHRDNTKLDLNSVSLLEFSLFFLCETNLRCP